MKIGELFVALGINADEKKAKDFFNVLSEGKNILLGLAAMAVGTSIGIEAMLMKSVGAAVALERFSAETGLSAQRLQAWQHVGEAVGLTADEMTSSISNLSKNLTMAQLTGQGGLVSGISQLNLLLSRMRMQTIDIRKIKDVWDLLEKLRPVIQSGRIKPQVLTTIMEEIGGSGGMIKVLLSDFERLSNKGAIISQDQIDKAVKFNAALKELGQTITYVLRWHLLKSNLR